MATASPSGEERSLAPAALTPAASVDSGRTLRPGGIGARAEQLSALVDIRAMAAWGTATTLPAQMPVLQPALSAPSLSYLTPASAARPSTTSSSGPARHFEFVERLGSSELVRQTAPLSLGAELTARPHVTLEETPRERAPDRATATVTRPAAASSSVATAPQMPVVQPAAISAPARPTQAAPVSSPSFGAQQTAVSAPLAATATTSTSAPTQSAPTVSAPAARGQVVVRVPLRLASAGLRAEQLAGIIGVRAADLSLDFVDPATLPALLGNQWSPEMAYVRAVAVGGEPSTASGFAPAGGPVRLPPTQASTGAPAELATARQAATEAAAAPLVARASSGARLSPEEWALVAAFPWASTAMQLAESRRSTHFLQSESPRAAAAPERALLTASPAAFSRAATSTLSMGRLAGGFVSTTGAELSSVERSAEDAAAGSTLSVAERGGAPAEYVTPSPPRALLPNSRQPRGGFIWPRAAGFVTTTASAVEQSSAAADRAQSADQAAPGSPLWESLRPSLVNLQSGGVEGAGPAESSTLSDVELARPFLELVNGSVSSDESRSNGVRFFEQPTPVVNAAAPSTDAATKMVEAVRRAPSHVPSDDRVSLGDLTLISVASATGQIAAAEQGSRPQAPADGGGGGGGKGGGGKGGGGKGGHAPNIEDLAQKVYDELKRVIEVQRERSGHSWER